MSVLSVLKNSSLMSLALLIAACGSSPKNKREMASSQSQSHKVSVDYEPIKNRTLFAVSKSKCREEIDGWYSHCQRPISATVSVSSDLQETEEINLTVNLKFSCQSLQASPQIIFALGKHMTTLVESKEDIQHLKFKVRANSNYKIRIIENWTDENLLNKECSIAIKELIFDR